MLVKQETTKPGFATAADFMPADANQCRLSEASGRENGAVCHVLHITEPQGMACRDLCGQYLCDAVTALVYCRSPPVCSASALRCSAALILARLACMRVII
jgi:hypothetical protein